MKELLTPEGKKWARYYYIASVKCGAWPLVGKYLRIAFTMPVILYITQEGMKEHVRKTTLPRM